MIYKMLYKTSELREEFIREATTMADGEKLPQVEQRRQAAKFQVEYYFGQTNYRRDEFLKSLEDAEGWIDLSLINNFQKMLAFKLSD